MKRKVLDINDEGLHLECIKDYSAERNQYKLYQVWYDYGKHRRVIAKCEDFASVIDFISRIHRIH